MSKDIHISPEAVEEALRGFLMQQQLEDSSFIPRLMEEITEDAEMLKLMKETEKTDNPSVPKENVWSVLNDE